ncbi:MAG: DUF5779 family protein [Halobacteriaceae archaeon]
MSDGFDLDLRSAEEEIEDIATEEFEDRVVLGVLDGTTPASDWVNEVMGGAVLLLSIEGDLNDLASPWAGDVKEKGATLMHFREFLVVAPPSVDIDTDRLG